jgi:hypothetical protein
VNARQSRSDDNLFVRVANPIARDKRLSAGAKLLYGAVDSLSRGSAGRCIASNRALAEMTGQSPSHVERLLTELCCGRDGRPRYLIRAMRNGVRESISVCPPEIAAGDPPRIQAGDPPRIQAGAPQIEAGAPPQIEAGAPPQIEAGAPPQIEAHKRCSEKKDKKRIVDAGDFSLRGSKTGDQTATPALDETAKQNLLDRIAVGLGQDVAAECRRCFDDLMRDAENDIEVMAFAVTKAIEKKRRKTGKPIENAYGFLLKLMKQYAATGIPKPAQKTLQTEPAGAGSTGFTETDKSPEEIDGFLTVAGRHICEQLTNHVSREDIRCTINSNRMGHSPAIVQRLLNRLDALHDEWLAAKKKMDKSPPYHKYLPRRPSPPKQPEYIDVTGVSASGLLLDEYIEQQRAKQCAIHSIDDAPCDE